MASAKVHFDTQIPRETRQFTWRVANFEEMKSSDKLLEACTIRFEIGKDIGFPCTFRAQLVQPNDYSSKWLGVRIDVEQLPNHATVVMMKWNELRVGTASYELITVGQPQDYLKRGWEVIVNVKETVLGYSGRYGGNANGSNGLLELDGSLLIQLELILYNVDGPVRPRTPAPVVPKPTLTSVMEYFQNIFSRRLSQDMSQLGFAPVTSAGAPEMVKLISKEGSEFSVNWVILAARSPVFKTMFQTPLSEVRNGVVKLDDIGRDALQVFLHFVHSGTLMDRWMNAGILEELAYAAHKYLMKDLLQFLDEALGFLCTQENCGKLFALAQRYELMKAEKVVLEKYQAQWKQAKGSKELRRLLENMVVGLSG